MKRLCVALGMLGLALVLLGVGSRLGDIPQLGGYSFASLPTGAAYARSIAGDTTNNRAVYTADGTTWSGLALTASPLIHCDGKDFASAAGGLCTTLTCATSGLTDGRPCAIGATNAAHVAGSIFDCWASDTSTITMRQCCQSVTCDPPSANYLVQFF